MARTNIDPPQFTAKFTKRFWSYVDKTPGQGPKGECWKWTKGTHGRYGGFSLSEGPRGSWRYRTLLAHRVAFFLATGYWTPLYVCHTCDWPLCCNPSHLFEGTAKQNYQDAAIKGRSAKGERIGTSKLTPAQVLEIRRLRAEGMKLAIIAKRFDVSSSHVSLITGKRKVGGSWSHI
jgi:hypothetical protein